MKNKGNGEQVRYFLSVKSVYLDKYIISNLSWVF